MVCVCNYGWCCFCVRSCFVKKEEKGGRIIITNEEILKIALQQSAYDCNCNPNDFLQNANKVVVSAKNEKARKYLSLPIECNLVSYGNNIVASTSEQLVDTVTSYVNKYRTERCFETPNMHVLNDELKKFNLQICFMAEYFLPDMKFLKKLPCKYELKNLHHDDLKELYTDEWSNALCSERKELDVLAVGAYDNNKLVGLAGCSADCEAMYQIGIDVLPKYRRQGIASSLTAFIAAETLKLGKIPFYCAAWSNIKSVRNAIKSGFRPAWVELTAKNCDFVDKLNR